MYRATDFEHGVFGGRSLKQVSFARWPSRLDFAIGYAADFPVRLHEVRCVEVFELAYQCATGCGYPRLEREHGNDPKASPIDVTPADHSNLSIMLVEDGRLVRRWTKELGNHNFVVLLFQFGGMIQPSDLVDDRGMVIVCSHVVVEEVSDFTGFGVS